MIFDKTKRWLIILGSSWYLIGCFSSPPPLPVKQSLFLEQRIENYQAKGRILLKTPQDSQSGDLVLTLDERPELSLQIAVPLVGTVVYEIRANSQNLMILDFQNLQYFLRQNHRWNRWTWLGTDLELEELLWIIFARMREDQFQRWNGVFLKKGQIQLHQEDSSFELGLNESGLIRTITKNQDGVPIYFAEILDYHPVGAQLFPTKIKITNPSGDQKIVLVFTQIDLPPTPLSSIQFVPPLDMQPMEGSEQP